MLWIWYVWKIVTYPVSWRRSFQQSLLPQSSPRHHSGPHPPMGWPAQTSSLGEIASARFARSRLRPTERWHSLLKKSILPARLKKPFPEILAASKILSSSSSGLFLRIHSSSWTLSHPWTTSIVGSSIALSGLGALDGGEKRREEKKENILLAWKMSQVWTVNACKYRHEAEEALKVPCCLVELKLY